METEEDIRQAVYIVDRFVDAADKMRCGSPEKTMMMVTNMVSVYCAVQQRQASTLIAQNGGGADISNAIYNAVETIMSTLKRSGTLYKHS